MNEWMHACIPVCSHATNTANNKLIYLLRMLI